MDAHRLHKLLAHRFDLDELRGLTLYLNLDIEELGGSREVG